MEAAVTFMLYNVLLFSCVFSQREADVANLLLELSDRFRRLLSLVWLTRGSSCAHSCSDKVKHRAGAPAVRQRCEDGVGTAVGESLCS